MAWLVDALQVGPGRTVVDVGAGTGKFSALLVPTGATVIAVEPLESMRTALAAEVPGLKVADGTAEALPMADGSADAITAAQALHWFDLDRALPEFHRVLRPDGRIGVIWNEFDTSVDWVDAFNRIVAVPRAGTPHPSAAGGAELAPLFGTPHRRRFAHAQVHDRESLLDRVNSMSFVAVQSEPKRRQVLEDVARLIDTHPQLAGRQRFELRYLTKGFWTERKPL